jgi:uncharacterized protein (TIGR03437 family)
VSPGELVTIFGANLGPASEAQAQVTTLRANTDRRHAGLIGGIAAPMLFASSTQINAIVPFGVTGTTTQIQVSTRAACWCPPPCRSSRVTRGIFGQRQGGGQGRDPQPERQRELPTNPAAPGSVVVLYAPARTHHARQRGRSSHRARLTRSRVLPVSVSIYGLPAQVIYAGAAPGLVAGVLQINVVVPAGGSLHVQSGCRHSRRLCQPKRRDVDGSIGSSRPTAIIVIQ